MSKRQRGDNAISCGLNYLSHEQQLIEQIKVLVGSKYIGDDCALVDKKWLVTTDSLVEGTHFILTLSKPYDLGWKALAVNLSDVAAMAGKPRFALVAVTVPRRFSDPNFKLLYQGIVDCAEEYDTIVVGGDITSGPVLVIAVTLIGEAQSMGVLTRDGAKPKDVVVATGDFGASACGLEVISKGLPPQARRSSYCLKKQQRPSPRLAESWLMLKQSGGRAALIDASDGLADALAQICRASGVGMKIDLKAVPIHSQTQQLAKQFNKDPLDWALYGGEDYELVGTLSSAAWRKLKDSSGGKAFKAIGVVTEDPNLTFSGAGESLAKIDLSKCFEHFPQKN